MSTISVHNHCATSTLTCPHYCIHPRQLANDCSVLNALLLASIDTNNRKGALAHAESMPRTDKAFQLLFWWLRWLCTHVELILRERLSSNADSIPQWADCMVLAHAWWAFWCMAWDRARTCMHFHLRVVQFHFSHGVIIRVCRPCTYSRIVMLLGVFGQIQVTKSQST